MTGFNHGMTGAVIALAVKNPAAAVLLSFISHYVIDSIPHFGFKQEVVLGKKFNIFHTADFLISVGLMIILALLFPHQKFLIWACMITAAAPDAIWWFYRRTVKDWPKGLDRFTAWHFRVGERAHTGHFYYDASWFLLMWAIVIIFKIR